jgi:hypothetical protein
MQTIESRLSQRTDLSPYLVHFTRDTKNPLAAARDNLLSILQSKRLEARNTHAMTRDLAASFPEVAATQNTVSFTETPLEHARMMCADIEGRRMQFNGYGLAFTKALARRRGVNPVWYLDITPGHGWLTEPVKQLVADAVATATPCDAEGPDPAMLAKAPILQLTPFIDQMGNPAGTPKEFSWEREWRHVGHFDFTRDDLVAVLAPEHEHETMRDLMTGWRRGYKTTMPTFIDVNWEPARITAALDDTSEPGPFPQQAASS